MIALLLVAALDVAALVEAFDRLAAAEPWPGFDAARVPLLVYDGEATWLVRHPSPPPEFEPPGGSGDSGAAAAILRHAGRHDAVRANTSVVLAGARTATLLADGRPAGALAAVLLHEAFHVYEQERHPDWAANELDLVVYPVLEPRPLALRRMESRDLAAALAAAEDQRSAALALRARAWRDERFALLGEAPARYERCGERYEGLARYVERFGEPIAAGELERGFPAADVRERVYASGRAWALLLDRHAPGWKARLEGAGPLAPDRWLDEALALALAGAQPARVGEAERAALERALEDAEREVAALAEERRARRAAYLAAPGFRVEVIAPDADPLWPSGFDPLGLTPLGAGELLHERWVRLANGRGQVEVLDAPSLSAGVGEHPLFEGVRRLTLTGLDEEPRADEADGVVTVAAGPLRARFANAALERTPDGVVVRLR